MAKVLVIDDEPMILWPIQQVLGAAGHQVCVAESAAQGLRLFQEQRPDVILLDIRLPDVDGLTILRRIVAEGGPRTAVIMMTAFDDWGANRSAAMSLGAAAYLAKPFDFEKLDTIVRKTLAAQPGADRPGR
ncbi:MAG: response regulator [Deltaproteobacteria bacterium]|nr:response regulator [Deltaproteobacteria bacterium]